MTILCSLLATRKERLKDLLQRERDLQRSLRSTRAEIEAASAVVDGMVHEELRRSEELIRSEMHATAPTFGKVR